MDLYGLKEDALDVGKLGASALAGAAVAKKVSELDAVKDVAGGWVAPLIPIAVGVAVHSYGKSRFPVAAPGVAAGMVVVGLGKLLGKALGLSDATKEYAKHVPFAGLGFTYDSPLMGLGYSYGAGVDAYMHGSPTQVQAVAGMPVQIQQLQGLGSTIVGGSAPLSASLM